MKTARAGCLKQSLLIGLLALLCGGLASAQIDTATLVGTVQDPTGAVVPGATVTAINTATNVTQTATTDAGGEYVITGLLVGTYSVTVEATGFKKFVLNGITLNVQDRKEVGARLQVGAVSETVQVEGSVPLLQTQTANEGPVIGSQQVVDLPLNGRQYDTLALLAPGATVTVPHQTARAEGVFVVNGNESFQNNFILDGIDNNSFSTNLQEQSAQVVQPAVDSLAEFKMQTRTYDAEFGRNAGSEIIASIKSGTNNFHGDGYEFLRNASLDANNFFLNRAGVPKPRFQQNQFGATLGGPIRKDHTFFFLNYEGTRINEGTADLGTVPTPLMRQNNFTELSPMPTSPSIAGLSQFANCLSGGILNPNCIDPAAAKVFALYPMPNTSLAQQGVAGGFVGNNYITAPTETHNTDQGSVRIDHKFGEADSLFGHFAVFDLRQFIPGIFAPVNAIADGALNTTQGNNDDRGTSIALSWTHVLRSNLVNDARVGFNRIASHSSQAPFGQNVNSQFGINGVPVNSTFTGGLPEIDVAGFSQLGSPRWLPQNQFSQVWQFVDTLNYIRGSHNIKTGVEIRRDSDNFLDICCNRGYFNFNGQYTGQGMTDFLLGQPFQVGLTSLNIVHQYQDGRAGFVQDTWRTTSKLTFNYGLRYEFVTPTIERNNHITNFDPTLNNGQGGLFTVSPTATGLKARTTIDPYYKSFAPRFGFAYQVSDKLVLRGGGGIFWQGYDRHGSDSNTSLNAPFLTDNEPFFSSGNAPAITLQGGFPNGFLNPVDINNINAVKLLFLRTESGKLRPTYVEQASLGFEYSVAPNTIVGASYVGNAAHRLWLFRDLNQGIITTPGQTPVIPFPLFSVSGVDTPVEWLDSVGNSSYNALQVKAERRWSNGLSFLVSYVWSKSMTDMEEWLATNSDYSSYGRGSLGQDSHNLKAEKALGLSDVPHRLVTSFSYALPVGKGHSLAGSGFLGKVLEKWQANGIVTYAAGQPIEINLPFDTSNTGGFHDFRPNCIATPSGFTPNVNQWLQASAYAVPAANTFGSCGPAPGPRAPGLRNWDFSLFKQIPLSESKRFEFRAEFFNLFNTTQFGAPNSTLTTPTFGQIATLDVHAREIQVALKFYF